MNEIHRTPRFENGSDYLDLSYEELQKRNESLRTAVESGEGVKNEIIATLRSEKTLKAVMVCFSDAEGRLHRFDFNKQHFIDSVDNLTFDGSSIKGLTSQDESDLRLIPDFDSFYWLPGDVFGKGKVAIFANIHTPEGEPYSGDHRSILKEYEKNLGDDHGFTVNVAPEVEGFLVSGQHAEQNFTEEDGFHMATRGGYADSLPRDLLRQFIDQLAEAVGALGFKNEKDHPEVAPGQFEINYKFANMVRAADQVQLLKIAARQIADSMGLTATFLPKPSENVNGSGMHLNLSISKENKNLFYDADNDVHLSEIGREFIVGILNNAKGLCLALNSSINSFRRLSPEHEAPNEVKTSDGDRGSMVRIPVGDEKSARAEVRTAAPDASPYLAIFLTVRAGIQGVLDDEVNAGDFDKFFNIPDGKAKVLPSTLQEAIDEFKNSNFIANALGRAVADRFSTIKQDTANRSPRNLGNRISRQEIVGHHEVATQGSQAEF